MRLIEDHRIPRFPGQRVRLQAEDGIRGQRHVRSRRERALWTMIHGHPEPWPKPVQFVSPVVQHAGRGHYQGTALEDTERLQGFAKSHIVGE